MSGLLVEVVARYINADGVPSTGTVSLNPVQVAGNTVPDKRLVTKHSVAATLDSQGMATLRVLASDDPDWNVEGGVLYEVREYIIGGRGRSHLVYITGPGPVDLFDLQPVEDVQTVAPYPVPGPPGPEGPPGLGIRILSAVPTVADLPAVGEDGDAHLVVETGDLYVWGTDDAWHDSGHIQGPPGPPGAAGALNDLDDVDTSRDATGMVITRQSDGTYKGQNVRVGLNQLTDVTVLPDTPPNSLLGTVGDGLTPGVAEWEPLHLDYVQEKVLGGWPSEIADLGARVTELEHTSEVVPPDFTLGVDLYDGSFIRIIGCDAIPVTPDKRIVLTLATTPGFNGAVYASLADISGTGAVWADFNGRLGRVFDSSGGGVVGSQLKEAIRRGAIVTVHRDESTAQWRLVVVKSENPADAGSSLTLDALKNVTAPASTAAGMLLGTTAVGAWGPVANPLTAHLAAADPHAQYALRGLVGNLLTPNQASGGDALGTTAGLSGYAATIVRSTAQARSGSGSILATQTTGTYSQVVVLIPDQMWRSVAGRCVTAVAWIRPEVTATVQMMVGSSKRNYAPATATTIPAGVWSRIEHTFVVPDDESTGSAAVFKPILHDTAAVYYADNFGFWEGAGGDWAMPGTPILNQGRRVTHPNVDDVLVEVWDDGKARWQRAFYHSGVRSLTSPSAGQLVRVGDTVTWTGTGAAPAGFRDSFAAGAKTYQTSDPVPASLPGTLVSPAPN